MKTLYDSKKNWDFIGVLYYGLRSCYRCYRWLRKFGQIFNYTYRFRMKLRLQIFNTELADLKNNFSISTEMLLNDWMKGVICETINAEAWEI